MPPQFFVKLQYSDRIKKIGLTEDEFTWDNMSKILAQSFSLPRDRLKLTYKDPEGDEITACCDEDLIEAYRACSSLQPMRFFVYLCNNAPSLKQNSLSVNKDLSDSSKDQSQQELQENNSGVLKVKSENVIPDQKSIPEIQKALSEGALQSSISNSEPEDQVNINTEEIGRILEEILLTKEAQEKILRMRKLNLNESKNSPKFIIEGDQTVITDCVTNIFNKVLNETIELDTTKEEKSRHSVNSIVESLEEHINKNRISMSKDWKSMEEEKYQQKENNLLNSSLKESIYEKSSSVLSPPMQAKADDFKDKSFAGTSMSFCRDLSSTYGVKLALRFENGKMKLMSVPTQEYSIIDSVENPQQNDKSESLLRRSASVNECPNSKKSSSPDYSEYYRLSLVD